MGVLGVVLLVFWVAALVDVIVAPSEQVKRLPKIAWVLLVVFLSSIGALLWFALGRDWSGTRLSRPRPAPASSSAPDVARRIPPGPDGRTTEQQLADLDREIELYRRLQEKRDAAHRQIEGTRPQLELEQGPETLRLEQKKEQDTDG